MDQLFTGSDYFTNFQADFKSRVLRAMGNNLSDTDASGNEVERQDIEINFSFSFLHYDIKIIPVGHRWNFRFGENNRIYFAWGSAACGFIHVPTIKETYSRK